MDTYEPKQLFNYDCFSNLVKIMLCKIKKADSLYCQDKHIEKLIKICEVHRSLISLDEMFKEEEKSEDS